MQKLIALILLSFLLSCAEKTKQDSQNKIDKTNQKENFNSSEKTAPDEIKTLANNFKFTEGPAVDAEGNVYFTDIPEAKIWIWTTANKLELFREDSGGANGLFFDENQNLLICEGWKGRISKISPDGNYEVVASEFEGKRFNQPNDIWPDGKGGFYFTDPEYNENPALPQIGMHVYYVNSDYKVIRACEDLIKPNGLVGTPDGKLLYVTDPGANKTYQYQIKEDGSLDQKKLFYNAGGDGMTIDQNGSIYLTTSEKKAIDIINTNGDLFYSIALPKQPSNVCFGGKNRDELYITARTSIYKIKIENKGVN